MDFFNQLFTWNNLLIAGIVAVIAYFFFGKNLNTTLIAGAIALVVLALVRKPGTTPSNPA